MTASSLTVSDQIYISSLTEKCSLHLIKRTHSIWVCPGSLNLTSDAVTVHHVILQQTSLLFKHTLDKIDLNVIAMTCILSYSDIFCLVPWYPFLPERTISEDHTCRQTRLG